MRKIWIDFSTVCQPIEMEMMEAEPSFIKGWGKVINYSRLGCYVATSEIAPLSSDNDKFKERRAFSAGELADGLNDEQK